MEKKFQMFRPVRTEFGKAVRKAYDRGDEYYSWGNIHRMLPRNDGISNTITCVDKDTYVLEINAYGR